MIMLFLSFWKTALTLAEKYNFEVSGMMFFVFKNNEHAIQNTVCDTFYIDFA